MDKPKDENTTKPQGGGPGTPPVKNVEKGLSSLKSAAKLKAENPVENRLESKMPSRVPKQEDDAYAKIEIPTSSGLHQKPLASGRKEISEVTSVPTKIPTTGAQKKEDTSIFGGASEVSRIKLEREMRLNPKAWQAQRQAGLSNLTPMQRAEIVKKDIPQIYGRDISKSDLSRSIMGLNRKLANAQNNPQQHERIRKEIKFLKKIGGIK